MARVWVELPYGDDDEGNMLDVVRAWYEAPVDPHTSRDGDAGSTCAFEQVKFIQVRPGPGTTTTTAVYDFGEKLYEWDPYATPLFIFFALRDASRRAVLVYGAITFERVLALGGVVTLARDLVHSRTCVPLDWLADHLPSESRRAEQQQQTWWLPVYALTRRDPARLACPLEVLEARIAWLLGERDEPYPTLDPEHEYASNLLVPAVAHLLEYEYSIPNSAADMTAHHVRFMANRLAMEEQRFYDLFEAHGATEDDMLRLLANDGHHIGEVWLAERMRDASPFDRQRFFARYGAGARPPTWVIEVPFESLPPSMAGTLAVGAGGVARIAYRDVLPWVWAQYRREARAVTERYLQDVRAAAHNRATCECPQCTYVAPDARALRPADTDPRLRALCVRIAAHYVRNGYAKDGAARRNLLGVGAATAAPAASAPQPQQQQRPNPNAPAAGGMALDVFVVNGDGNLEDILALVPPCVRETMTAGAFPKYHQARDVVATLKHAGVARDAAFSWFERRNASYPHATQRHANAEARFSYRYWWDRIFKPACRYMVQNVHDLKPQATHCPYVDREAARAKRVRNMQAGGQAGPAVVPDIEELARVQARCCTELLGGVGQPFMGPHNLLRRALYRRQQQAPAPVAAPVAAPTDAAAASSESDDSVESDEEHYMFPYL